MQSGKEAKIFSPDKNELAYIYYKQKYLSSSELLITIDNVDTKLELRPKYVLSWNDPKWTFQFDNALFELKQHKRNDRSLFRNNIQVASFTKERVSFFERDVYQIYANSDENIILLICLAIFDDIGRYGDNETATSNYGSIHGSKVPMAGKWRPSKT